VTEGTELSQALDAALAAYQRHYGRARAMERLRLMLARGYEAQRILDEANGRIGGETPKAAE
jgi:hypothetical protein